MKKNKILVKVSSYYLFVFGMTCFFVLVDLGIPWKEIYPLILRHIFPAIILAVIGIEGSVYLEKKGSAMKERQSQSNQ